MELKIKIMDKIKEIETRLRIGYTMSVYGNNAEIHDQMTDDIKTLLEVINYIRCCTELKVKEKISFEEWLRVEDIKIHQDGTFYISSERRYVELNFLINRYNSLNL